MRRPRTSSGSGRRSDGPRATTSRSRARPVASTAAGPTDEPRAPARKTTLEGARRRRRHAEPLPRRTAALRAETDLFGSTGGNSIDTAGGPYRSRHPGNRSGGIPRSATRASGSSACRIVRWSFPTCGRSAASSTRVESASICSIRADAAVGLDARVDRFSACSATRVSVHRRRDGAGGAAPSCRGAAEAGVRPATQASSSLIEPPARDAADDLVARLEEGRVRQARAASVS